MAERWLREAGRARWVGVLAAWLALRVAPSAFAQQPELPPPPPPLPRALGASLPASLPPAPPTALPPAAPSALPGAVAAPPVVLPPASGVNPAAPAPLSDQRLRDLESQNALLNRRLAELEKKYDALNERAKAAPGPAADSPLGVLGEMGLVQAEQPTGPPGSLLEELGIIQRLGKAPEVPAPGMRGASGPVTHRQIFRIWPPESAPEGPEVAHREEGAQVNLEEGIRISSPDRRYRIEFHDLSQAEYRNIGKTGDPLVNSYDIPRQRLYFLGQVDDWFDFYSVYNRGYGSLDLLDSYVNFKFDRSFNIRMGRTKTPYTYEYYKIAEGDLIAPERSLFVGNLAPNREIGTMVYGRLLEERFEYATGIFNGPHRSFQDFNSAKNAFLFVNTKPFLYGGSDLVRQLNIGGSVNGGVGREPTEPNAFRTMNDETVSPNADNVSPTFLRFKNTVSQLGSTAFWSGDIAWYYRSFNVLASFDQGFMSYTVNNNPNATHVHYNGYSVVAYYFITGEEITGRKEIAPLRPFNWRRPFRDTGGIEMYSRISYLQASDNIYTAGLVDPALWSRSAVAFDNGFNWYLNRFIKVYVDWQHSEFSSQVQVAPGHLIRNQDMFVIRTQLFY